MTTVTEGHTVRVQTSSDANDLMTHANTEDGLVPLLHGLPQVHGSLRTVVRVTRSVRQEQAIVLVTNSVEVEVPWKHGDGSTTADKRTRNVCLGAEIEDGYLHVTSGVEFVRFLGGNLSDKVLGGGVSVFFSLRRRKSSIISDGNSAEGGTLVTKESSDGTGIDTSDTWDAMTLAPVCQRIDGEVVRVPLSNVVYDDSSALNVLRLEVDTNVLRVDWGFVVGDTIVSDQRCREYEDLTSIRRICHGLGVYIILLDMAQKQ